MDFRQRMNKRIPDGGRGGLAAVLAVCVVGLSSCGPRESEVDTAVVERGPFAVWSVYDGVLDARRVEVILSRFSGNATVAELAPEGKTVEAGDLLVRFDDSALQRELLKLERDAALAKTELESLSKAQLPLELRNLQVDLLKSKADLEAEQQYLKDSDVLRQEDLVSAQEVEQQKLKVDQARSRLEQVEMTMTLTREYVHPLKLDRARATLDAAQQELQLAREQLTNGTVRAPSAGMVVYRPLHIGTEYRTVRVGDTLFKNQAFMAIPDMRDIVVECHVPEAELSRVQLGRRVEVISLAYPDLRLEGSVESIGSMAQALPGRSSWQKYFRVVIGVSGVDPRLRSGMSVQARVMTYEKQEALRVPRRVVEWVNGRPLCRVRRGAGVETRAVKLGMASLSDYEVLDGLKAGDVVLAP